MNEFYTSVARIGNSICYRGYKNGERKKYREQFKPTLYVTGKKSSNWKTLDGKEVHPVQFDEMKEATDFAKQYEYVDGINVYGMLNFVSQYIEERFPGEIKFDPSLPNVVTIDIEVASDDGFPEPELANKEVVSIALRSSKSPVYYVWGLGDYDTEKSIVGPDAVRYVRCQTEVELLTKFLSYWSQEDTSPDVVSGWNSRLFDIPYLVNRMKNVMPKNEFKKMSPWGMVREKQILMNGRQLQAYELTGIEQLDGYDLFQKFGNLIYGVQESYKLDHIAWVVLGEKKLSYEEHGNLHTLYKEDFQKFIDYNIKDVQLVERIDDKVGLVQLAMFIAYKAGCNYMDAFGTTALWDTYIYRSLTQSNIVVPQKEDRTVQELPGGYVKQPMIGRHPWILSFDLNSLYPHLMLQYNMSPETVVNERTPYVTVQNCLDKERPDPVRPECSIAANGVHFKKSTKGVIPSIIDGLYTERKTIKKEMLKNKQKMEHEGSSYELEKVNDTLDTQQMAIKIMMNSLYGAIGNRWFRYYDHRIAEAITTSGQLSIRWAEKAVNEYMNKLLETSEVDYVIAIDTDSVYVNFGSLVEKFGLDKLETKQIVAALSKVAEDKFIPLFKRSYDDLAKYMNAYANKMVMEREAIADTGIWTAKKRYILNVHNSEGVEYKKPKLKIMGIEAVKSSTPNSCREALKELFKVIINTNEKETQSAIQSFKSHFRTLPPQDVAFPRGARNVAKWVDGNSYKSGCPIHVRGSILFNNQLVDLGLQKRYNRINDGEKVKFVYLKEPNPIGENVIAFLDYLPEEFDCHKYVDYDKQFDKAFVAVVEPVMEAIGWSVEERASLDEFFS